MIYSKPSSDPTSTLRDTIIDREPGAPSGDLTPPHRLDADSQSKANATAETRRAVWSPRPESGTLWVRPWGGK